MGHGDGKKISRKMVDKNGRRFLLDIKTSQGAVTKNKQTDPKNNFNNYFLMF